jgi:hypothetical protein
MIGALMVKKIIPKGYDLLNKGNLAEFMKD